MCINYLDDASIEQNISIVLVIFLKVSTIYNQLNVMSTPIFTNNSYNLFSGPQTQMDSATIMYKKNYIEMVIYFTSSINNKECISQ